MTLPLWRLVNQLWWFCVCCINQCPRSPYQNKKLIVQTKEGETRVQEKSRVLDEKCHLKTVEFVDEATGQVSLRTVQVIEKTIEHEVARCSVVCVRPWCRLCHASLGVRSSALVLCCLTLLPCLLGFPVFSLFYILDLVIGGTFDFIGELLRILKRSLCLNALRIICSTSILQQIFPFVCFAFSIRFFLGQCFFAWVWVFFVCSKFFFSVDLLACEVVGCTSVVLLMIMKMFLKTKTNKVIYTVNSLTLCNVRVFVLKLLFDD